MVEQLFGSKTRVKLLRLFFSNPNRSFYVREITRKVEEQINSVRRELSNLLSIGIITSDSTNNKLYYEVNQDYEYYEALRGIFSEAVTAPKEEKIERKTSKKQIREKADKKPQAETEESAVIELPEAAHWNGAGNLVGVAYSGVYTRDESAGVDIVVVGNAVISKIESVITEIEKEKNRELRYALIEPEEWKYRQQVRDKFWLQFMGAKKQIVLDKHEVFKDK